eukprot:CAMPEP_0177678536 /NCGR_PEP_ID=MMETSP0447-20121125/29062_1 /TAXON_ID=0 /ORGANISM="Stygamoeba regulata, Strain BSH-02190019" /LENGTH=241 /DNA_ID=CAMNT_0019187547 /DNA_START=252 /DNA_END=977 /DNA_ORIENTATION=+
MPRATQNTGTDKGMKVSYSIVDLYFRYVLPGERVYRALRIPKWVWPEAIVFTGFFFSCLAGLSFSCAVTSAWGGALAALFVYGNLIADHMDGRHARATNQCTNGGEILDHFFDPLSFSVITIGIAYAVGRLDLALLTVLGIYGNVSTVFQEAKITGTLALKTVGPAEARILFMTFGLVTSYLQHAYGQDYAASFVTSFLVFTGVLTLGQMSVELFRTVRRVNREGPPPDCSPWKVGNQHAE